MMDDGADWDDAVLFTHTTRVKSARKDHKCNMCGNTIEKGKPYRRVVIVDDEHRATTWKEHGGLCFND